MPFRILHTADLHLDLPIAGVGPTPPALTARLATAAVDTLDRVVDLALAEEVDALAIAGGLWVGPQRDATTARRLARALDRLAQAQVQVLVARHRAERLEAVLDTRRLPDGVHVLSPDATNFVELAGRDGSGLLVMAASGLDGLAELSGRSAGPPGVARLGLCPVPGRAHGVTDPPLADTAPDYWALGGRVPAEAAQLGPDGAWAVMPGPPQLHQPGEPGVGCGVVLAELDGSGTHTPPRWERVAEVELITVVLPLAPATERGALEDLLDQHAADYAATFGDRPVVLRAVLHGDGPLRGTVADPLAEADLLAGLRAAADRRDGFVWWSGIRVALLPGPAAEQLVTSDRDAAALVRAAAQTRSAAPADVLAPDSSRGAALGSVTPPAAAGSTPPAAAGSTAPRRWPLPGAAAWAALVTEGTSLGFDLLRGPHHDDGRSRVAPKGVAERSRFAGEAEHPLIGAVDGFRRHLFERGHVPGGRAAGDAAAGPLGLDAVEHRLEEIELELRATEPAELETTEAEPADPALDADADGAALDADADRVALDEDIEATEGQLATARAQELRLTGEVEQLSAAGRVTNGRDGTDPADTGARLDDLREALRRRREAQVEADAATTTATVLRLGLERSVGQGRSWVRWIQPVALAVASASVLVAVALLTSGMGRAGIAVAVLALASAAAALFLPTRPLRERPDVVRMRLRLERADDDIRRWNEEVAARAAVVAERAAALGLPAEVTESALYARRPEGDDISDVEARLAARSRQLEVARNTASAAAQRLGVLRRERGAVPADAQGRSGDGAGRESTGASERARLRQEHRGLVDELNRLRWELDRLAVTRRLLTGPIAERNESGAGSTPSGIRVSVTPAE